MKIIKAQKRYITETQYKDLSDGAVFWTQDAGVCIKTELGPVNLYDGKKRLVSDDTLITLCEATLCAATCYWSETFLVQ